VVFPGALRHALFPRESMLVVFSDTHLSDETTSSNVNGSAFELLAKEIASASSPKHKNARRLDFLLLGDIIDLLRTSYWQDQGIPAGDRPWNGTLNPETGCNADTARIETQFLDILERILATDACRALIKLLRRKLPFLKAAPTVTYVVGNHDRAFSNFPSLQDRLRRELPGVRLEFTASYRSDLYQVLARHGHQWDLNNHGWHFLRKVLQPGLAIDRFTPAVSRVQCIGDVVTAELLSGMIFRLKQALSGRSEDDKAFLRSVYELNNLRPFPAVFEWLAWFCRGQPATASRYHELLRQSLQDALATTLDTEFARHWDRLRPDLIVSGDLTDQLVRAHAVLRHRGGLRLLAQLRPAIAVVAASAGLTAEARGADGCAAGAAEDFAAEEKTGRTRRYVFYGHTHEARQECLQSTHEGTLQLYLNTGTFLPFVERARQGRGFWTAHRLTYAFVHADDEDRRDRRGPGPTLDLWNGLRCKSYVA